MDCIRKLCFSHIFTDVIKKLISDNESYVYLKGTQGWKLAMLLASEVTEHDMCERQCLGCLEYTTACTMFNNLIQEIISANSDSQLLLDKLCERFKLDTKDPLSLALDLAAAPEYLKSKIEPDLISEYENYERRIKGAFLSLALHHYSYEQTQHSDTICSYGNLERDQITAYIPYQKDTTQNTFYLDQNIISKCSDDLSLKKQIVDFRRKTNCELIYSPYVIEDGIKMSRVRLAEYLDTVSKITNSSMLANINSKITFVKEDIEKTYTRVLLWREATRAAEDLKISKLHFNRLGYPHYAKNSRLSRRANKDINEFLESLRPYLDSEFQDIDFDDYESDHALCRRLYAATIEKSFSLDELVNRSIRFENDSECIEHIEGLCDFLDLINYQTESLSETNKIRSSLQDVAHLKFAWKTDFFVTGDNRLRKRGELIYSALGLTTKFISLNEFKLMITKVFTSDA